MNESDFYDAGYRVFGLYGVTKDGQCECGNPKCPEAARFKHPRFAGWQYTPDWSEEQWEVGHLAGQFNTGYGVLVRGLLVVDVDARNGGLPSFVKLCTDIDIDLQQASGLAVATGSGGGSMHLYFRVPPGVPMVQSHGSYPGVDFKSSGFVVGPGSLHSSGNTYEPIHGHPDNISDAPAALLELLRKPDMHRAEYHGETLDVTDEDLIHMLSFISPDCDHETWYRCGMALHHATGGTGFAIWNDWSSKAVGRSETGIPKYPGTSILEQRWHSFGKSMNPVTLGTLAHYAYEAGWRQSVTFEPTVEFDDPEPEDNTINIDGIDLLRPPGFVGKVCEWINAQSRYPRENLAVAAAITAMGNVIGLRYTDDVDKVTGNLFSLCVAASSTGKEAVQQVMTDIHRAAGIHRATHGSIKSEQEIVRNLVRNQAAFYIIDELGIFLQKIANAQKKGSATYLDGVIGILMSAYSKANGYMLLNGDTKDEVRKALTMELMQARKAITENEDKTGSIARRVPQLERALNQIDNGLERPFLSMIGFTTGQTFDHLVTYEQATNGFLGRSWLILERETNPRRRRGTEAPPMPEQMRYALSALYSGGSYDPENTRVEHYGERIKVSTETAAKEMLSKALDWVEDYAELHKERTGLEAVVRRGYELMAKISLILAAPGGVRTAEHVRWAFAAMRRDIEDKTRLAYANEMEKENPNASLMARILNMIDTDHGETVAVIQNRTRKSKKDVEKALGDLEAGGQIELQETEHPYNGSKIKKWFARKQ